MNRSEAVQELMKRNYEVDPLQFEHLCKLVIEEIERPEGIETTRRSKDGGIDVRGFVGGKLYNGEFGVQVKQYDSKVSSGAVRGLAGSLQSGGCRFGTLITTSSFTSDAIAEVNDTDSFSLELIDGEELAELMLDNELGVKQQPGEDSEEYIIDPEFWGRFEKFSGDLIPSWQVPQADSDFILGLTLTAVKNGVRYKPEIAEYLARETEDNWTPRQADYYTTAGQILGYLEEGKSNEDSLDMRRWSLTEAGDEYVSLRSTGKEELASDHLAQRISRVDIIEEIVSEVKEEYKIPRSRVEEIIRENTEVTGTTVRRRTSTVGKWLGRHPDVKRMESGMVWFEYYKMDLTDF
ncbi:restriction system protein [Halomicrobium zhouii]|uniref:Restriction system protein n=1 Tax=Halomicrobium zhouii TaxID=767519 RepID=A0A1I6K950_9EURY|nr:restriction endonuclease [Halomicrobium zhouii]SFR87727.1 restriction system protein [Halomicrobium zhouii]